MKRTQTFSLIRIVRRALPYFLFILIILGLLQTEVNQNQNSAHVSRGLDIQFHIFSPAYAAFEDEYLFDEFDQMKSETLLSGLSSEFFLRASTVRQPLLMSLNPLAFQINLPAHYEVKVTRQKDSSQDSLVAGSFSAKNKLSEKKAMTLEQNLMGTAPQKILAHPKMAISIGPIVSYQQPSHKKSQSPVTFKRLKRSPSHRQLESSQNNDVEERTHAHEGLQKIAGTLELTGGIALLGHLEVSWVVEDEEYSRGQIWLKDGYYEVPVSAYQGEIIISLFDENNRLIGEGIAYLEDLSQKEGFDPEKVHILIKALDTSLAGRVYNGTYIDTNKPVTDAEVTLFGIDETATTNSLGQYHFNQWKNSSSRTIALASKKGFYDSIYMIDSSQTHEVFLFPETYMKTLFARLEEIGFDHQVREQGLVYGRIEEKSQPLDGIEVSIHGHRTVYYQAYMAMAGQQQTATNGLFTMAGLESGEHELVVERYGKVIDRRIVVVEAGKVSPIVIEIGKQPKKIHFFDPLVLNKKAEQTGLRFFEGEEFLLSNKEGHVRTTISGGKDPALIEFAQNLGDENNIFVSRAQRFEQIPVVNSQWFLKIKEEYNFSTNDGLAVGFVTSDEPYVVTVAENAPDHILYFDKKGAIIKPSEDTPPAGFIFIGLQKGLHTIICESRSGSEIFFTDMIYNNQQSISVLYKNLE